jgi:hypothetical protein
MASNCRIWRDSNTVPVTDIVEFNGGALPDATGGVIQNTITLTKAIAVNSKPKKNLDELQDTGLSTVTWQVTGHIKNPKTSAIPDLVKKWLFEDNFVVTTFPHGRFGLQLDDFPHYNVRPNANRGIMLESWNWIRDGETAGKASFVAVLRFSANDTGKNSPTFEWDTT